MKARCPKCGRKIRFSEYDLGRRGRCSFCGQLLVVMRNGKRCGLEMAPASRVAPAADKTMIAATKTIIANQPEPLRPPQKPKPRKFKLGDHIGLYQPWVVVLVFGGLVAASVSVAVRWSTGPGPDAPSRAPMNPATTITASPPAPQVPASQPMTPPADRPSPSTSPPPGEGK